MDQLESMIGQIKLEVEIHETRIRELQKELNERVQALVFARGKLSSLKMFESKTREETSGHPEAAEAEQAQAEWAKNSDASGPVIRGGAGEWGS